MLPALLLCSASLCSPFSAEPLAAIPLAYIPSTTTAESENLRMLILAHFELERTCEKQAKMPSRAAIRAMARGAEQGYLRFFPCRYDHAVECFAYCVTESGGNTILNRYEAGCTGVWIDAARAACESWNIPCPRSRDDFTQKLLEEPEWCTFVTYASFAMVYLENGGDTTGAVGVLKYGANGWTQRKDEEAKKPPRLRRPTVEWLYLAHWWRIRRWLFCVDERTRMGGIGNVCGECFPMLGTLKGP